MIDLFIDFSASLPDSLKLLIFCMMDGSLICEAELGQRSKIDIEKMLSCAPIPENTLEKILDFGIISVASNLIFQQNDPLKMLIFLARGGFFNKLVEKFILPFQKVEYEHIIPNIL